MESQANQFETELGKLKAKMKKTEEQHKAELTRAVQALELQIEKNALNLQSYKQNTIIEPPSES